MKSPEIRLREFAASWGSPVIERLSYDVNVGERTGCFMRCQVRGIRVELEAAVTLLVANMRFAERPIAFTINKPDEWDKASIPIAASTVAPVYVGRRLNSEVVAWFSNPLNCALVDALDLRTGEAVFVFANGVTAIGDPNRHIERWLSQLADLVFALPAPLPTVRASDLRDQLPDDLKSLARLLPHWAIGDDAERSEKIEQMSQRRRKALVARVQPLLPRINAYLDSFGDGPMPEPAIMVGELAELVAEITTPEA